MRFAVRVGRTMCLKQRSTCAAEKVCDVRSPRRCAVSITRGPLCQNPDPGFPSRAARLGWDDREGLRVLEATDVRGLRFRTVFIAGMIEGGFPLRSSRDWLYPHEERARLQKHGIFLEDISTDTLLKEEHYFYQAACRATERLYLTRPLQTSSVSETVASYYIEELNRAMDPDDFTTVQIRGDLYKCKLTQASTITEYYTLMILK